MDFQSILSKIKELYTFSPQYARFRKIILRSFIGCVVAYMLFVIYVIWEMPDFSTLENPQSRFATQILDRNGVLLGSLFEDENRVHLKPSEGIPDTLIRFLIATEDIRFYEHSGMDFKGNINILLSFFIFQPRGGSTVSQQLARNLYDEVVGHERSNPIKTVIRKFKEMIVSAYLERNYTKEEIITYYLNTVAFGANSYGVQSAAKFYFEKQCKDLAAHEVALLVGLLKGPTYYSPFKHAKRALDRRNTVIEQAVKYGLITEKDGNRIKKNPLGIKGNGSMMEYHSEGLAPYFRENVRQLMKKWCEQKGYNLYKDGLKIHTTIDARMQKYAENAMMEHLSELQVDFDKQLKLGGKYPWEADTSILPRAMRQSERYRVLKLEGLSEKEIMKNFKTKTEIRIFKYAKNDKMYVDHDTIMTPWDSLIYYARYLQPGAVAIEPSTGHVLAWVGGINHKYFKYDHVEKGKRQVGSTFKPFVYAAAFDNGFHPCSVESNTPPSIPTGNGKIWRPENADATQGGDVTLRYALANSLNTISARVIHKIGPETVIEYANRMGITSKLEAVYSLALGTTDLNVLEMTAAYATFANLGKAIKPNYIVKIEDKNGNVIEQFVNESQDALNEITSYLMIDMLRAVVNSGTAAGLRYSHNLPFALDICGKTGTTQNHSDGWFVGFTPDISMGCWVGCEDRSIHFNSIFYGQGARLAMPIFGKFMNKVYNDPSLGLDVNKRFNKPKAFKDDYLDCKKYKQKNGGGDETPNINLDE